MEASILKGIRILDFTRVLAGPYATRLLADFGAEVIKLQSAQTATGAEFERSGYFNTWNRNKKSITLNLNFPEAREIALELVKISDVVIENFSPRVMSNFGMSYDTLKALKPDLIMLSMSGMGQTGPWKDYVAFGPTVQALGGLTYLTSFEKESPLGLGNSYADPVAGLYGALAVLAALIHRDKTGEGQYIDLSGYEAVCNSIGPALLEMLATRREPQPQGNTPDYLPAAPHDCYRCFGEDRWCTIAVFSDTQWAALCRVMGDPGWTKDDRFTTLQKRKTHKKELDQLISQWTSDKTPEELVHLLQDAGVSAGVVQTSKDLANDPHLKAREFFLKLNHPVLGETISDRSPIRFDPPFTTAWKHAPLLGEDNRYVYCDLLGFSEEKLSGLIQTGVVG